MTLAAGSIGYAATGTMDGALTAAYVGNMVGSATARFTVACFAAGTPLVVDFEGNSRSIEEIEVGDYVLARSEFDAAGPLELKRVEEKFVRVAPVMELVVRGQVITTTAEHPLYVAGEERFVPAGELTLEDQLVDSQGRPIAIDAIRVTDRLITVYNLRVADFHTYFVGGKLWQFDAWVHNASYAPSKALSTGDNAEILGKNLAREGRGTIAGQAAGHIVASTGTQRQWAAAARSREILAKYRIGINDAANGVPIGTPRPHNIMHNRGFHNMVEDRLKSVVDTMSGQYGHKAIRAALRRELRAIGRDVLEGL